MLRITHLPKLSPYNEKNKGSGRFPIDMYAIAGRVLTPQSANVENGHILQRTGGGYREFLMNETRYSRLTREFPDRAEKPFVENEETAMERYQYLLKLQAMYDDA